MEGDISDQAVLWASTASRHDRIGLIKRLLNICQPDELNAVSTVQHHTRRKKLKPKNFKPEDIQLSQADNHQPTDPIPEPVFVPSNDASLPDKKGWWSDWIDGERIKIVAFDCEMVAKPNFPEQCQAKFSFDNNLGIRRVLFVPKSPKDVVKFHNEAATVHICDFYENKVYDVQVKHAAGSYTVNKYTYSKNGFEFNSLSDGVELEEVRKVCAVQFKENLCVGCSVVGDFECLKLKARDYASFDLQTEYKGPVTNNGVVTLASHSLRSIYSYFFHQDIQSGIHSASTDAKATMRIFRDGYIPDKIKSLTSLSQDRSRMYDDEEMPRLK